MEYKYKGKGKIKCADTNEKCNNENYLSSKHWKKRENISMN